MSHKVLYSKLFTPPNFLEMSSVSLALLPTGISFLLTKNTEYGRVPGMHGIVPLPTGAISQGEIVKKEVLIKSLIEIRKKTKVNFVRFSIPEEKTYLFKTNLPDLSAKEIRNVLDFKIEENVPLATKEAVFDYDIIPKSRHSGDMDAIVSVTALKFVEEWQGIFKLAGLTPVFFSPESNNVARAVVKKNNEQIIVVVNIRQSDIIFSLVVFGVVCQTSSINFGSSTFSELLAKYFKVAPEEVQKIMNEKLYSENNLNMDIFSRLINTISAIKDELYKFISYCNEKSDMSGQVDRVILCGREALIVGLDKYLTLNLNLKVEVANVWVNNFELDEYVPTQTKLESMDLAILNGLSLF